MRTDALIQALSVDAMREHGRFGLPARLLGASAAAGIVSFLLLLMTAGLRPDLATGFVTGPVAYKLLCGLSVCAGALVLSLRLASPERRPRAAIYFLPVLLLLGGGVILEAVRAPADVIEATRWGPNPASCLTLIGILSVAPLVAILAVLRSGAPRRPARAGAIAGLLAGGVGGTLYTLSCPIDEAAFVALWYGLAVVAMSCVGAVIGRRVLAW